MRINASALTLQHKMFNKPVSRQLPTLPVILLVHVVMNYRKDVILSNIVVLGITFVTASLDFSRPPVSSCS